MSLIRNTRLAIGGDAAALQEVAAWATRMRARFDQLLANRDVTGRIIYALGSSLPEMRDQRGRIVTPGLQRG